MTELPTVKQIIKLHNLDANKSLGQNFIINNSLTDKIVKFAEITEDDVIVEIGAGPGCLTRSILQANPKKLIIIEKDARFAPALKILEDAYPGKLVIYNADALEVKLEELVLDKYKIISNLPYNISAKLITNWLIYEQVQRIIVMVQDEMADRIIAGKRKDFGRLAVISNLAAETKKLFKVSPAAFHPPPKITSAVIGLKPYDTPLYGADLEGIAKLTQQLFKVRRKNLRNVFRQNKWSEDLFAKLGINPTWRAEDLSLEQIVEISKNI